MTLGVLLFFRCSKGRQWGLVEDWQARFVHLTKPGSDLYDAIKTTALEQGELTVKRGLNDKKIVTSTRKKYFFIILKI